MTEREPPIEILSFGESLVDFLPDRRGVSLADVESFRKVVGGAPTNMALGVAQLGCDAALMGKIGEDAFGDFVLDSLDRAGVDTRGMSRTDRAQTGLTFVTLDEDGDRSFLFYRDPSADMLLRTDDIVPQVVEEARIFQVGSNLLTDPAVREATEHAIDLARTSQTLLSVDPNIRPHLWESTDLLRDVILEQAESADIFKVNEEELEVLVPGTSPGAAWRETFRPRGIQIFMVTLGSEGAILFAPQGEAQAAAREIEVVDTTGAGDGFMSGFLAALTASLRRRSPDAPWRDMLDALSLDDLQCALELGTWVGTTVCSELGATPALPTLADLPNRYSERLTR